jgi:hypothetical protein
MFITTRNVWITKDLLEAGKQSDYVHYNMQYASLMFLGWQVNIQKHI